MSKLRRFVRSQYGATLKEQTMVKKMFQLLGYDVSHICTGQVSNSPSFEIFRVIDHMRGDDLAHLYEGLKLNNFTYTHVLTGYMGTVELIKEAVDIMKDMKQRNPNIQYCFEIFRVIDHMRGDDLAHLYEGLKLNNFTYTHVLTGYMGTVELIKEAVDIMKDMKQRNPNIQYFCDPIMGENGTLYVEPGVVDVFREELIQLADVICPNQYELSLLSGIKIETGKDLVNAMDIIHGKGVKTIVVTSTTLRTQESLSTIASSVKDGVKECYKLEYPRLPFSFVGTGDIFVTSFLVWLDKSNLKTALEKSVSTLQCILKKTIEIVQAELGPDKIPTPQQLELRYIQSKPDIEDPPETFTAVKWE